MIPAAMAAQSIGCSAMNSTVALRAPTRSTVTAELPTVNVNAADFSTAGIACGICVVSVPENGGNAKVAARSSRGTGLYVIAEPRELFRDTVGWVHALML